MRQRCYKIWRRTAIVGDADRGEPRSRNLRFAPFPLAGVARRLHHSNGAGHADPETFAACDHCWLYQRRSSKQRPSCGLARVVRDGVDPGHHRVFQGTMRLLRLHAGNPADGPVHRRRGQSTQANGRSAAGDDRRLHGRKLSIRAQATRQCAITNTLPLAFGQSSLHDRCHSAWRPG